MGDELALIALIFRLKESGTGAVSLLLAVFAATRILLAPFSGSIVDQFATRPLITVVSMMQFSVALILAVVDGWITYPLVFFLALGASIVGPAWQTFIAHVVPPERLSRTYAFIQSYRSIAIVAGAGLGGFIVARFGSRTALVVDAATFIFVGAVAATLSAQRIPAEKPRGVMGVTRGFVVFVRNPTLRWSLILLASFNMAAGVSEVLSAFFVTDELGGSASDYGLILGSLGASMFLSGMILSRYTPNAKDTSLLTVSATICALGMVAYGLSFNVPTAIAAFAINGIGMTGLHSFGTPILIRNTNEEERGRVFAASSSVTMGGMLIATGIAGAFGELFPPRPILISAALACLAFAMIGGFQVQRHDARNSSISKS